MNEYLGLGPSGILSASYQCQIVVSSQHLCRAHASVQVCTSVSVGVICGGVRAGSEHPPRETLSSHGNVLKTAGGGQLREDRHWSVRRRLTTEAYIQADSKAGGIVVERGTQRDRSRGLIDDGAGIHGGDGRWPCSWCGVDGGEEEGRSTRNRERSVREGSTWDS